ncbi:MAG: hypothetical protein J6Y78_04270 [Paludibacteraceae bacterium]|nr:hypothetical protein [Paludibacteraceae bacterium]
MEFNNKTILITGLIICSGMALVLDNHDVALAIVSGLVGYLSKDALPSPIDEEESGRLE